MRFPLWLAITSCLTMALTGCEAENSAEKQEKREAANGRAEVTLRMAHTTESTGDYEGAEALYIKSLKQSAGSMQTQIELAEFYKRHHEDRKAIDSLNSALAQQPDNSDIERELANTYIGTGEPEKALTILDRAIAANPRSPLLYNSRGVALDQIGSYAEAQKSYASAFDLDPEDGATYKVNISMSYILSGKYDKAILLLRPMLDAPDSPPIVRQNLALAYGLKGESENALKLGLQDLSTSEAEENLRFYRMLAARHNAGHPQKAAAAGGETVPASVVKELFPEGEPEAAAPTPGGIMQSPPPVVAIVKPAAPPPGPLGQANEDDDDDSGNDNEAAIPKPVVRVLPPAPTMGVSPATAGFSLPEPVLKPED